MKNPIQEARKKEIIFGILLLFVGNITATTYYIDATNGLDSNGGLSEALAWKTISKVNSMSFLPGDNILFKRGEVWREQLNVPSSGSAGNPITFGAYGSGAKPVINGESVRDHCIYDNLGNISYIIIDSITVTGGTINWGGAIDARGSGTNWIIQNSNITQTGHIGIMMLLDNSSILNNNIYQTGSQGIHIHENSIGGIVRGNTISYSGYIEKQAGINLKGDNYIIEKNTIDHTSYNGIYLEGRPSVGISADNNIIRFNLLHDNGQGPTWADITNGAAIYTGSHNNQFSYNVIYGPPADHATGIWVDFGSDNNLFYNNIIYGMNTPNQGYGITFEDGAEGGASENNVFKNNLIANSRVQLAVANTIDDDLQGNALSNNLYYVGTGQYAIWDGRPSYRRFSNLSNWQNTIGSPDIGSIGSNPLFTNPPTNDFHLQLGSPAIDAGVDVGLTQDYDGNLIVGLPDIGAFEFQSFQSLCTSGVDINYDDIVSIGELLTFISRWKAGEVFIGDLLTAISEWKNGC